MRALEAGSAAPEKVFRWPRLYDGLLTMVWRGAEDRYRDKVLELAGISDAHNILDVGSGTGTQAIAAKRRTGSAGRVAGVDSSAGMVARARRKATALGLDVEFVEADAQRLPFANATFDVVLSTTVMHCLPESSRADSIREMARVLKHGGRLLLVDFGGAAEAKHSFFGHMHAHRHFDLGKLAPLVTNAGLIITASGALGFSDLQFILASHNEGHER